MPKALKLIFRLLILIIFCLVLAVGLLVSFVDPNHYKDELAAQISQQAGREFKINKRLSWSLLPNVKIIADDVTLANRQGFGSAPMIKAEQIGFRVSIMPLLFGQIDIDKITIKDAVIQLGINRKGQSNWTQASQTSTTSAITAPSAKPASGFFKLKQLDVRALSVTHSTITLNDQRVPRRTTLIDINYSGRFSMHPLQNPVNESHVASPLYLMRQMQLDGRLRATALTMNQHKASNFKADIRILNNKLTIKPISLELYGGRYDGEVAVDVSGKTPKLRFNQAISRVGLAPFFEDIISRRKVTGTLQANMQLNSQDITRLPKSLNGKASVMVADGELQGIDLSHTISLATAFALRQSLPKGSAKNSTPFKTMTGSILIKNGIVQNDNFSLDSPVLSVKGRGQVNLNDKQMRAILDARLLGPLRSKTYLEIEKILGGSIPLLIDGLLTDFTVKPNYKIIGKSAFDSLLKSKAGQKIQKSIGDALQGLFKKPAQ